MANFEGWSHTVNGMDEEYGEGCDCEWEFPGFRESLHAIQQLIRDCTMGCFWGGYLREKAIARIGTKIFSLRRMNCIAKVEVTIGLIPTCCNILEPSALIL